MGGVGIGQGAAGHERNSYRAEISGSDGTEERERTLAGAGRGTPLHSEKRTHADAGERESVHGAHGAHAGQRGDAFGQLTEEGDAAVGGGISSAAQGDANDEDVFGPKARVHGVQADEAAEEEAGGDEHHHGQRQFGDGEGVAEAA